LADLLQALIGENKISKKDYFFDKKKVQLDFSATRVRVEGVGSPRVAEKVRHEAPTASGIREVEKSTFFLLKMGFSLPNWLFQQSFVVLDYIYTSLQFKTRLHACPCL
jgi:hypothetical protein